MTNNLPAAEFVAPPADLATVLRASGLRATLAVERLDGAPLTAEDRANLPLILDNYTACRDLNPTDEQIAAAVVAVSQLDRQATGTNG